MSRPRRFPRKPIDPFGFGDWSAFYVPDTQPMRYELMKTDTMFLLVAVGPVEDEVDA